MSSKSAVVTAATSASRSSDQGASASARAIWASMIEPPCRASSSKTLAMKNAQHRLDRKARGCQQFGQLVGVEFAGVERVDRGVTAGGEGNAIGRRHQQHAAGPEYASALGHELPLIPKVFDDLEVDHHIDLAVGQRELGEIPVPHLHPRIPGPYMRDGRLVVIQPDDPACHTSDQVGSVTLAAAGLEHVESDARDASRS